jgi:cell division protein FtsL
MFKWIKTLFSRKKKRLELTEKEKELYKLCLPHLIALSFYFVYKQRTERLRGTK